MSIGGTYQHQRYTAAVWTLNNYELKDGELGFETDTGQAKINLTGANAAWNSLPYWGGAYTPFVPSLKFSIPRNSQYLPLTV